jgi:hypothetical protein
MQMRSITPRNLPRPGTQINAASQQALSRDGKPEILTVLLFSDIIVFVKGKNKYVCQHLACVVLCCVVLCCVVLQWLV